MSSSPAATSQSCSPAAVTAAAEARPFAMPPALRNAVREWSRVNGPCKPDVIVRVQEHCFALHRDPITSQSSYLKRRLSEFSDIAVDLPAGLTVDAFVDTVASCYGAEVVLSPASLAAAWAAADWLELRAEDGMARRAEDYFFQEVATDHGRAAAVLRSCTAFLGGEAAGAGAALLVRCLETLASSGGADGRWLEDVAALPVEEFEVAVEAMRARFAHDHDLMYTIVDHYLENHRGKLTEEEKSRVCYNVNCTKLSHHLFMHLVQNPRLPLRFVVQAMLVEQLHSHHSMLLTGHHHAAAAAAPSSAAAPALLKSSLSGAFGACGGFAAAGDAASSMTLGDILQRDAVLRQSAHIRASMQATSQRIDSLERELAGLRTRLRRSEQAAAAAATATASAAIDRASAKSASFRIPRSRLWDGEDLAAASGSAAAKDNNTTKGLKSRLVLGFKNLFGRKPVTVGAPPASGERATARVNDKAMSTDAPEINADADELVSKEERTRPHRRNLSIV
ncbi:hypothetical protein E2562_031855 [Oryza meyeriana var. granulata]|uniref:NPH3 domain-containing protein n=1 Tax=Oryza meyeriana var. granulata TaxID=110450 RepID=A0A6G1C2Z8_9ORYZ|nr:hypothetical protein E2562_031855 [Oryza meyeriana var. granulata]